METELTPPPYDPNIVRVHTSQVSSARRISTLQLLRVGRHIGLARRRLDAAQWELWLADVGYSLKEGELLAAAAARFSISQGAEELSPSAIIVLSVPDVPPAAVSEALALARRGELVTHHVAARLIKRHSR